MDCHVQAIKGHHIIGLVETHCCPDDELTLPGFYSHRVDRPMAKRARKPAGGIAVLISDELKSCTKVIKMNQSVIWLRVNKANSNRPHNLFVGVVYIPPENSNGDKNQSPNSLELIEGQIRKFSQEGEVLLVGDLNARTALELDYVDNDTDRFISPLASYPVDSPPCPRSNQDEAINSRGRELIDLCIATRMRILNGRVPGDSLGFYTCHKYNGSSTVDYAIASDSLLKDIQYLHVNRDITDLSDHCMVSVALGNFCFQISNRESTLTMDTIPAGFKWDKQSALLFQQALCGPETRRMLEGILNKTYDESKQGVEAAVTEINNVILTAASSSLRPIKKSNRPNRPNKKWFGGNLVKLRREVAKLGRLMTMFPRDPWFRGNYHRTLKHYRRSCKNQLNQFKRDTLNKLDMLHDSDPGAYWKLVQDLRNGSKKDKEIDPETFYEHYVRLNTPDHGVSKERDDIQEMLKHLESIPSFTKLDSKITTEEVSTAICRLKNNKAQGLDMIKNEMIKSGQCQLLQPLTKVFNLILNAGIYPSAWCVGRIVSIYKKGDFSDPGNFRGITISSALSKTFNSILNERLCSFLEENNIMCPEQIGFKKKCRTSDHMFILQTIINKYKRSRKPLYIAFIDFKKAYDTVWHDGLFFKLLQIGVSSRFYKVVKAMYTGTRLTVQAGDKMTPIFNSRVGVRQGDNLSPTLFNVFINDLPGIFDAQCKPVHFGNMTIQSLLYADDLVLFAESPEGLQHALNRLSSYCDKWGLTVSETKSKFMCIQQPSQKECKHNIVYKNTPFEQVASFRYLGTLFDNTGNMLTARRDVYNRALKVFFKLLKDIHPLPKVSTSLHLFDRLVVPVLQYGSEIWCPTGLAARQPDLTGDPKKDFYISLRRDFPIITKFYERDNPGEKLHLKFNRIILGVHKKASNLAVYGELGRYPLFINEIIQSLKYAEYLASQDNNQLLQEFYFNMTDNEPTVKKGSILDFAESIKQWMGYKNVVLKPSMLSNIKKRLRDDFECYWLRLVQCPYSRTCKQGRNKLRTYSTFKSKFQFENYLNIADPKSRKDLSRLRVSAHRLHIETQRFNGRNLYIPVEQRICSCCDSQETEDEFHFVMKCARYTVPRESMFNSVREKNIHFSNYTEHQKFIWLMSDEDLAGAKVLAKFISNSLELRKLTLG